MQWFEWTIHLGSYCFRFQQCGLKWKVPQCTLARLELPSSSRPDGQQNKSNSWATPTYGSTVVTIPSDNMKKTLLHLWPGIKIVASLTFISTMSGHTEHQAGWVSEKPVLMEGVPSTHGREAGTRWSLRPLPRSPPNYSVILWSLCWYTTSMYKTSVEPIDISYILFLL